MKTEAPSIAAVEQIKNLETKLDEANWRLQKLEESKAQSKRDQKKRVSTLTKNIAEMEAEINVFKETPSTRRTLSDEDKRILQQKKNLESVLALQRLEVDKLSQYLHQAEEQLLQKENELAAMSLRLAELEATEDRTECLMAEMKSLEKELILKEEQNQHLSRLNAVDKSRAVAVQPSSKMKSLEQSLRSKDAQVQRLSQLLSDSEQIANESQNDVDKLIQLVLEAEHALKVICEEKDRLAMTVLDQRNQLQKADKKALVENENDASSSCLRKRALEKKLIAKNRKISTLKQQLILVNNRVKSLQSTLQQKNFLIEHLGMELITNKFNLLYSSILRRWPNVIVQTVAGCVLLRRRTCIGRADFIAFHPML